jgi:hypothetical protein
MSQQVISQRTLLLHYTEWLGEAMPDISTEVAIASQTLGSAVNTITFSSIPSTYTDFRVVSNYSLSGGSANFLTFNNNTSILYSETNVDGDGSSAGSSRRIDQTKIILLSNGTGRAFHTVDVFNYAGSTFKTSLITQSLDANGSGTVRTTVGLFQSTSAINRLDFTLGNPSETFTVGSTFTLYGIL